jgi:hypothetical protein
MNQLYRTGSGFSGVGKSVVRYKGNIRKMEIRALPHLGNQLVEAIKGDALAQYFQWRVDHAKKTPAISTLRTESTVSTRYSASLSPRATSAIRP